MKRIFFLLAMLAACPAWGQIEGPTESEPYKLIHHKLAIPVPAGAKLMDGGWEVIGAAATVTADVDECGDTITWTGTPGVYTVHFDAALVEPVEVVLPDGTKKVINSYIGKRKGSFVCTIKGGVTPPPVVNPYKPAPAYQAAVEPVRKLSLSQPDSAALASLYFSVAGQVRAGSYASLSQIRSDLVKRGGALSLKGKYAGMSQMVDTYLMQCLGLSETVPVASVGDVFETLAWAVFETGVK